MPFSWADALAYLAAIPRVVLRRHPELPWGALARMSALDVRQLPRVQWFRCADGERIAYRTYGARAGLQVVLVHGSACFGDQLSAMAQAIARTGLAAVHTVDMRGHGHNARAGVPFRDPLEDLAEFAGAIGRQALGNRVVVGGHSAGGGLVLRMARSAHGRDIAGWLLLAPFLGIANETVRPWFGGWVARIDLPVLGGLMLANLLGIRRWNDRPIVHFNREAALHDPRYVREWSFATMQAFGPGSPSGARPVDRRQPMLLVCGDRDDCFRAERYARAIARLAPHAAVQTLPDMGHWDILTQAPAIAAVTAWLRSSVLAPGHMAEMPPSSLSSAPVMKRLSSEAR